MNYPADNGGVCFCTGKCFEKSYAGGSLGAALGSIGAHIPTVGDTLEAARIADLEKRLRELEGRAELLPGTEAMVQRSRAEAAESLLREITEKLVKWQIEQVTKP